MIFSAVFTTLCRRLRSLTVELPYHTGMQLVKTLLTTQLYTLLRILGDMSNFLKCVCASSLSWRWRSRSGHRKCWSHPSGCGADISVRGGLVVCDVLQALPHLTGIGSRVETVQLLFVLSLSRGNGFSQPIPCSFVLCLVAWCKCKRSSMQHVATRVFIQGFWLGNFLTCMVGMMLSTQVLMFPVTYSA